MSNPVDPETEEIDARDIGVMHPSFSTVPTTKLIGKRTNSFIFEVSARFIELGMKHNNQHFSAEEELGIVEVIQSFYP